ncbi:hypothetical protein [uncultured Sphingomonas sp.]|uniref:hypothetical protein n=1 Tax=uncultured Sphingomonas sp. TaxID=158754 RepID=UPI0035CB9007
MVRRFAGHGLFTALGDEPNWGKAQWILLPATSQNTMRGYFDMIVAVCEQLVGATNGPITPMSPSFR